MYLKSKSRVTQFLAILFVSASVSSVALAETKQEHLHRMGHSVIHFDMSSTVHIFKMTERGGMQQVVAKDHTKSDQTPLI